MSTDAYDLAVIGGGSGGLTAAIMGARLGARVILIDKTDLGGDCLHYGCVPSKALIASARLAHQMRHADRYGLSRVEPAVDAERVMQRIRDIQGRVGAHDSPEELARHGVEVAFGGARFRSPHEIMVGDDRLIEARFTVIATGSHAVAPPIPGLEDAGFLNHRSLFSIQQIPQRVAVIGGGPIGCEMGQALSRLGSQVTILQRGPRILKREDPDASAELQRVFESEGIAVWCTASASEVRAERGQKELIVEVAGATSTLPCDEVLVAVGRRPTLSSLDLDAAGVAHDRRGVTVDETLATSQRHIYAVGDCNGGPQFTHWAEHEARIATRNALFKGSAKRDALILPRVTFTDPEVASVGLTLAQAQTANEDAHAHTIPMAIVDRAQCESAPGGFVRVIVDKKDRILGAHAVGFESGELLAEIVLAMKHGIGLSEVGEAIHAYPTITRATRRVADARFFEHGLQSWTARLFANFTARDG